MKVRLRGVRSLRTRSCRARRHRAHRGACRRATICASTSVGTDSSSCSCSLPETSSVWARSVSVVPGRPRCGRHIPAVLVGGGWRVAVRIHDTGPSTSSTVCAPCHRCSDWASACAGPIGAGGAPASDPFDRPPSSTRHVEVWPGQITRGWVALRRDRTSGVVLTQEGQPFRSGRLGHAGLTESGAEASHERSLRVLRFPHLDHHETGGAEGA